MTNQESQKEKDILEIPYPVRNEGVFVMNQES